MYIFIVTDLGFSLYSLLNYTLCVGLKGAFVLNSQSKSLTRYFVSCVLGKHKNRWRDSSAENRVIGDYEVEEWKDIGMCTL